MVVITYPIVTHIESVMLNLGTIGFHHPDRDRLDPFRPKDAIVREMFHEDDVKRGYVEIWDLGQDNVLGAIKVSADMYSRWYIKPSKFKPETIKALGLENLTWEDEPVEI